MQLKTIDIIINLLVKEKYKNYMNNNYIYNRLLNK